MTYKENITAILECYFPGFKKEIIDSACSRILEQNHQAIFDAGYKQGINDGSLDIKMRVDGAYEKGLNDAWECIKKISNMNFKDRHKALDIDASHDTLVDIVKAFSPSEAIAKIKEYEEKQKQTNEIKVGDEVIDGEVFNNGKGIVTFASPIILCIMWYDGTTGRRNLTDVKKTGRTFPKISEVLEQLKEEEK